METLCSSWREYITIRMLLHFLVNSQGGNLNQGKKKSNRMEDEVLEILSNQHYSLSSQCLTFAFKLPIKPQIDNEYKSRLMLTGFVTAPSPDCLKSLDDGNVLQSFKHQGLFRFQFFQAVHVCIFCKHILMMHNRQSEMLSAWSACLTSPVHKTHCLHYTWKGHCID